jgi:hypothetical protein
MTNRTSAAFASSVLALAIALGSAEAKTVSYEIKGKRYTYESTSRKEVMSARKLIDAANAADRANAAAKEERAHNPLVAIFGSEIQQAATAAQASLEKALAEYPPTTVDAASRPAKADQPTDATTRAADRKPAPRGSAKGKAPSVEQSRTEPASADAGKPRTRQDAQSPDILSTHFDPASGIKTTFMGDGSIREELVDAGVLSKPGEAETAAPALARQPQDVSPADTTGSTTPRASP